MNKTDFMNITYKDRAYVTHLAPISMLEELKMPGQYGLALGITDDKGNPVIIGLCTFYVDPEPVKESFLTVRWFFIQPEYRKMGYGRELYNNICDLALNNKIQKINISFPDTEECRPLRYVFYEMDYEVMRNGVAEIYTTVEQVCSQPTIAGKLKDDNESIPLSQISQATLRQYIQSLDPEMVHLCDYTLPTDPDSYEKEVSHVLQDKNGELVAVFLVRHLDDALTPVIFKAKNTKLLFTVLSKGVKRAREIYSNDKCVAFGTVRLTPWGLLHGIFPTIAFRPGIQGVMELDA